MDDLRRGVYGKGQWEGIAPLVDFDSVQVPGGPRDCSSGDQSRAEQRRAERIGNKLNIYLPDFHRPRVCLVRAAPCKACRRRFVLAYYPTRH